MASWIEYSDCFAVKVHRDKLHQKSLFEAHIDPGISVSFGEPGSKLGSGRYKLIEVVFDKVTWDFDRADQWWRDRMVYAFRTGKYGLDRKLPLVDCWFDLGAGLYVFVCWRTEKGDHTPMDYIKRRVTEPGRRDEVKNLY